MLKPSSASFLAVAPPKPEDAPSINAHSRKAVLFCSFAILKEFCVKSECNNTK
jgi:hypothetical protein